MFGKITQETSKILEKEHENILKVADALDVECNSVEQGREINEEFFRDSIDFIKNYADKFHHAKEEDILFKEFNKCVEENSGCLHCNPVEQMMIEHNEGRKFVKGMEEALDKRDRKKLVGNARGYANLIREHIFKEDNILYPMADEAISRKVEDKMLERFREVAEKNKNKEKRYVEFARSLENKNTFLKGGK